MDEPERISSPYAPDLGEVRAFLERMIRSGHFIALVRAVLAVVARVCEVNGELTKKLADLRRGRPRSEVLERLKRQLPLFDSSLAPAESATKPKREKKDRKGRHPGRTAPPAHLEPIAKLIAEITRGPGHLGTDATGIPVLDPKTTDGVRTGAMWCWTNARFVAFHYSPSAGKDSVREFLKGDLQRTVQCDGTPTLTFLEEAGGKRPGCWSHGRRRLAEAARAGDRIALEGVEKIAGIFAIERQSTLAGDNAENRRRRRQEFTLPILGDIRQWLDDKRGAVPPKTPLGRALGYLYRQWRLLLFLDDGNIEATNNRRERERRRLILGRKNWLFTWLDDGGKRVANILSIIATCIAHEVNPRAYLHLATNLIVEGWPNKDLRELLPDKLAAKHPELSTAHPPLALPP